MEKKGEQMFTKPRTVVLKKSPYTYLLDDGRIWNTSHLSVLPEMNTMDNDTEQTEPQRETNVDSRPERFRQPPTWAKDYVMY